MMLPDIKATRYATMAKNNVPELARSLAEIEVTRHEPSEVGHNRLINQ